MQKTKSVKKTVKQLKRYDPTEFLNTREKEWNEETLNELIAEYADLFSTDTTIKSPKKPKMSINYHDSLDDLKKAMVKRQKKT